MTFLKTLLFAGIVIALYSCMPKSDFKIDISNNDNSSTDSQENTNDQDVTQEENEIEVEVGTIYYINLNGGTLAQCNGLSDAPYGGTGLNQNCAWKHPWIAIPPLDSSNTTPFIGGDTLIISNDSYMFGYGAIDSPGTSKCSSTNWTYDCQTGAIPSGTREKPTRILGESYKSGCSQMPELWGARRTARIFSLANSSHIQIQCLDLTDHEQCSRYHPNAAYRCDSLLYNDASTGIYAHDSQNVLIKNVKIHGLTTGVHAGRLTDWTMENVYIRGNYSAGWNGDIGANTSSNSGEMVFKNGYISWSGCIEPYPNPSATPVGCVSQDHGGYGDGIGTHMTGGNWTFDNFNFFYNVSDALDLLYYEETGRVTVKNSHFEGNAGNAIKIKGGGHTLENLAIIGNCGFFDQENSDHSRKWPYMVNHCRAQGNSLSLTRTLGKIYSNEPIIISNVSLWSEGDCALIGNGSFEIKNSLFQGGIDFLSGVQQSCFFYNNDSIGINISSENLVIGNFKETDKCNYGINSSGDSGYCNSPGFSLIDPSQDQFDLKLNSGSLFSEFFPSLGASNSVLDSSYH